MGRARLTFLFTTGLWCGLWNVPWSLWNISTLHHVSVSWGTPQPILVSWHCAQVCLVAYHYNSCSGIQSFIYSVCTCPPCCVQINLLLQAYISQLKLEGFALVSDMVYVTQVRVTYIVYLTELCCFSTPGKDCTISTQSSRGTPQV